ncbi:hypothetical protein C2S52_019149 [Perilla frutescens var. hirtella]|nr:hypothetical protein C2S52_019149 [Perilla frutescens var. hirtella]
MLDSQTSYEEIAEATCSWSYDMTAMLDFLLWRGTNMYRTGEENIEDDDEANEEKTTGPNPMTFAHAITLIGYGGEGKDRYFLVQNSHGLDWGHKGYIKVLMKLVSDMCVPIGTRSPQNRKPKQQ